MDLFLIIFLAIGLSTGIWFFLSAKMQRLLANGHPQVYEKLGKPTLFLNNSIASSLLFSRFMFQGEWKILGDEQVEKYGRFMLRYFAFHLVLFVFFVGAGIFGLYNQ